MNRWHLENPIYIKNTDGFIVGIMDLGDSYLVFELESGIDHETFQTLIEAIESAHNLIG